jgi:hypothetical protein
MKCIFTNLLLKWLRSLLSLGRPSTRAPHTWARTLLALLDNWNKVIWHMGTARPHALNKLLLETVSRLHESTQRINIQRSYFSFKFI